jgi:eukaryotic-like serine/threonine-protein kinase
MKTVKDRLGSDQGVRLVSSGDICLVDELIGAGGQGEVFRARLRVRGGSEISCALKLYYEPNCSREQWDALSELVLRGAPQPRFLWPIDMAQTLDDRRFGYVMPLRHERYSGLSAYLADRVTSSFRALTTAGFQLADSFWALHSRGLCYRDISWGNVFFDPPTGDVLICDNDNVGIDGQKRSVLGTPLFMAPEIQRGEATPSTKTDRYSLAVLLFYMFIRHHPLVGRRELDCPDWMTNVWHMLALFGTKALFIFDPDDHSNEPLPEHQNALRTWPIYPQFMRDLFTKAFTRGLRDAENGRVTEAEWKNAMVWLRDSIVYCSQCLAQNLVDTTALDAGTAGSLRCWSCGSGVVVPFRLRLKRRAVMLNHDTKLFPHHIGGAQFDFSQPVAEITEHPTQAGVWGLKNLSSDPWMALLPNGVVHDALPGRSVRLERGLRIQFPRLEGEVKA